MITANQNQIFTEQIDGSVDVRESHCWRAAYASRRHPFKSGPNEDALGIFPVGDSGVVFAVADGCGGMRGGEVAARIAMQSLEESIAMNSSERLRPAILDGIERANASIRRLRIGAACTLAVVEWQDGMVRPYHVGDAKIVIMGMRGRVRYRSICHSPVGFAVESGWLCEEEAMHHEARHLVSNVVGCERMRIEIGPAIRLGSLDTVLIASDGLFDNVSVDEGVALLRKGALQGAASRLMQLAAHRMNGAPDEDPHAAACKPDDLSLIAVRGARGNHAPGFPRRPR
jgi:serine/threonine protein phosphatase PrpC